MALVAFAGLTQAATPVHKKSAHPAAKSHVASKTKVKPRAVAGKTVRRSKTARKSVAARSYIPQQPSPERYHQIQQALVEKGYYKGEPTGKWDADSVDALKRFQSDQNLSSDGKLNSLSLIALGLGPKRIAAQPAAQPAKPQPVPPVPATSEPGVRP
jgi:peptidoglycan hydrolase-like protein with peptidoglycan-binding domain